MSDLLLEIARREQLKGVAKNLGVPVPPVLERSEEPFTRGLLDGATIGVNRPRGGASSVPAILEEMGATVVFEGADELSGERRLDGLCFDARRFSDSTDLDEMYAFFHERVPALRRGKRVVVIGAAGSVEAWESASEAAAQGALVGFVKSLARELGGRGVSVNLLRASRELAGGLAGALGFFLSAHGAYITAQPLDVSGRCEGHSWPAQEDAPGLLRGKVALVTGAAQGIGAATAKRLAREGAHVVCLDLDRSREKLVAVAREVDGDSLMVDLTSSQAPLRIASFLKSRHGGVDVVVHNAGLTRDRTLLRMKPERWEQVLEVNLRALERVDATLDEHALWREGSAQVYLSSIAGIAGNMGQSNYASAKAGVIDYVKWRQAWLAKQGRSHRVNAVAPGFIETQMTSEIPLAVREVGRRMNAFNQGGLPEDVAGAIAFLAAPLSCGVKGQVLRVCGGMLLGA